MRKFVLLGVLFVGLAVIGKMASVRAQRAQAEAGTAGAGVPNVAGEHIGSESEGRVSAASERDRRLVFGPSANLEREEISMLERAKKSIDVAMYSFTDMDVARELIVLQAHGVRVRVYRDGFEYRREEASGKVTTTALLRSGGIEVGVYGRV